LLLVNRVAARAAAMLEVVNASEYRVSRIGRTAFAVTHDYYFECTYAVPNIRLELCELLRIIVR